MSLFVHFFALFWGFVWAMCLTYTRWGQWLAVKRTWITVVVGVGVDLLILWRVMDRRAWWQMAQVIALSSVGIVLRSLMQEYFDADER